MQLRKRKIKINFSMQVLAISVVFLAYWILLSNNPTSDQTPSVVYYQTGSTTKSCSYRHSSIPCNRVSTDKRPYPSAAGYSAPEQSIPTVSCAPKDESSDCCRERTRFEGKENMTGDASSPPHTISPGSSDGPESCMRCDDSRCEAPRLFFDSNDGYLSLFFSLTILVLIRLIVRFSKKHHCPAQ